QQTEGSIMGKFVRVKYTGEHGRDRAAKMVCCDMTVGKVYDGCLPDKGETDPYGCAVSLKGELWITADDAGDHVVTVINSGFELVE
ncbi:hypothetical protein U6K69_12010, partial [Cutibacterium acnes]